jgi:hypothetical protein
LNVPTSTTDGMPNEITSPPNIWVNGDQMSSYQPRSRRGRGRSSVSLRPVSSMTLP